MTLEASPNTGMAVTMDIGDVKDIHPKNKQDVGRRLALWALAKVYGREPRLLRPDLQVDGRRGQQDSPPVRPRRRRADRLATASR